MFIFFILFLYTYSQNKITISGYISEKGSKENLVGVNIFIPTLKVGTTTNNYGFYSLTVPSCDSLHILISYTGYKTTFVNVEARTNVTKNFDIEAINLQEVVVSGSKSNIADDTKMSSISIPVEQIKQIPSLLGEKDVLKVIQLLPGVQKGSEGSSGVYVRGGGPDQNLILLDEATIYNANHLFGFFSVFNGDALKSVELIKGGFPARYGGRLSSVIDLQMKDGDKEKFKGEAGIGIISSRLTLEGPIIKNKCSFLLSGRRTYIDALIYPFMDEKFRGGYYFYDLNAKINYTINEKNKIFLSGYFGKDKFYFNSKIKDYNFEFNSGMDWGNGSSTLRWIHLFSTKLFANVSFVYTSYNLGLVVENKINNNYLSSNYNSSIKDVGIKYNFDFSYSPNHYFKLGINSVLHMFKPQAYTVKTSNSSLGNNYTNNSSTINSLESGFYIEDDWKVVSNLKCNIGIRLSSFVYDKTSYYFPEPRINLRYLFKRGLSLKCSYSSMNQYMHLLSSSGAGMPTDLWVPTTNRIRPQQSQQVALGLSKEIDKYDLLFSIETYYKYMKNIIAYKEGAGFMEDDGVYNMGQGNNSQTSNLTWQDKVTVGNGKSYGVEFLLQKRSGKLTGWIGYTLSWIINKFDSLNFGREFFPRYDRRHDVSVVGIYKVNDRINLSLTWVYATGNAITLPLQSYNAIENNLSTSNDPNVTNENFTAVNYYGDKNSFRMSSYHRLDFAIQFHKKLKKIERYFEIGIYNLYNRQNPFYYFSVFDPNENVYKLKKITLFPIIPSISWNIKF